MIIYSNYRINRNAIIKIIARGEYECNIIECNVFMEIIARVISIADCNYCTSKKYENFQNCCN